MTATPDEQLAEYISQLEAGMEDLNAKTADARIQIYGDSGTGKTVAAVRLAQKITPPEKSILFIDSGQGWASIQNHPKLKTRVARVQFTSLAGIRRYCDAIRRKHKGDKVDFGNIGCLILDESSSMGSMDLSQVVRARAKNDPLKDPDTPTQPDFNTATNRMIQTINDILSTPNIHVIFISHAREDKDDRGLAVTSPDYTPKLNKWLRGVLHVVTRLIGDEVTNTETNETEYVRRFQMQPTVRSIAKTRVGGMPTYVTFEEFASKLQDWLGSGAVEEAPEVIVPDTVVAVEPDQNNEENVGVEI